MRIRPRNKQGGILFRIAGAFGLFLLLAGSFGTGWVLWAGHRATLEKEVPAVRIPLSFEEKTCALLIPSAKIRVFWPDRIGLGDPGEVDISYFPESDLTWECRDPVEDAGPVMPQVFESASEPSAALLQKFPEGPESRFHWTMRFPLKPGVYSGAVWMKVLIRSEQNSGIGLLPDENLDDWMLATWTIPVAVVSLGSFAAATILIVSIVFLAAGGTIFLIFFLRKQLRRFNFLLGRQKE